MRLSVMEAKASTVLAMVHRADEEDSDLPPVLTRGGNCA